LCCSPLSLLAQPGIGQNGVVNRASQIPTTLAGGSIARGAAFTIHGVRFGSAAVVSLHSGNAVAPVRVLTVQKERIEAIMPEAAPLGKATLVVTAGGAASKPFSMEVAASNPGIFSQNKSGWGPGQIENIDPLGKRTINSTANPSTPGLRVAMNITGLGKGTPAVVVVGNRTVNAGVARPAAQPGEQEISFAIPPDAPLGCYVPVYLQASPTRASNVVTMTIQAGASSGASRSAKCDSGPIPLLEAQRIGMVLVTETNMHEYGSFTTSGYLLASFAVRDAGSSLSPILLLPPPGTCTAHTSTLQTAGSLPTTVGALLFGELGTEGLEAGPQLAVGRDGRRRMIPWDRDAVGYYHAKLPQRFFRPGKFNLFGPGGLDVGAFRVPVEAPAPFEWTDRDRTDLVARSRGVTLHWRGQPSGRWTILLAANVDQITTAVGTCLCTAPLNATHFEIPAALLANIPTSYDAPGSPYDQMFVASLPAKASPIPAKGIGAGALVTIYANGRAVQYH
jgi:uncharacterized protein (TIGR03437 family)